METEAVSGAAAARRTILGAMHLLLVRHAEAAPGHPDELRPLTSAGRRQARALAERLAGGRTPPDAVVTSPLLRARETATLIARQVGIEAHVDERLAPGATARDVLAAVAGRGEAVVAVAHQPDCGRIAAELSGSAEPPFPPAAMRALRVDP